MDEHFKRPKDTQAWIIQVWVSLLKVPPIQGGSIVEMKTFSNLSFSF